MNRGLFLLVVSIFLIFIQISCDKFESDQTVPAYLRIDTFLLKDNPDLVEGMLSHGITDVWVFADDDILGAFELPAVIPVLKQGSHKITLAPGIKYNGMSGTRGPYPFFASWEAVAFDLFPDSVHHIIPEVKYYSNTVFSWLEDFEDGFISFEATSNSDTSLQLIEYQEADPLLGHYSGRGALNLEDNILEVATNVSEGGGFTFPAGSPVFMEINFRANSVFLVGLYVTKAAEVILQPVLVMNPTGGKWKKIYVNFSPSIQDNNNALYFNFFLRMESDGSGSQMIEIDNIKLVNKPAN
ncbi:MAG: hypothetical protein JXA03_10410 [Bacteroidales bacterium]|nr:hypothetical protein [Bacteroidales bacterium]